jgi:3-methylfumaryl-CoA hydratase
VSTPREFEEILERWRPAPEVVHGEICTWPAAALAALLGVAAPLPGDVLPPLWHELYLHPAHSVADLGEEGHPRESGLLPPLTTRRRMFGGGRITVDAPLRLGETVTRAGSVKELRLREGRSGWLLLLTEIHELSVGGVTRVRDERDIVYRLPEDVARTARPESQGAGPPAAPAGPPARPRFRLDVDERFLFMFSALTYNAHRIHYDRRYAHDVEGHPDLLVHGPLLAIAAIEAARRHPAGPAGADRAAADRIGADRIGAVSYRLVAPSYPGPPILFTAEGDDGPATTVVGAQDGVPTVRADVTWRDS